MFDKDRKDGTEFDEMLENVTFDSASDNKIIIRDREPRRKVRRRVKKGTKEEVLARRKGMLTENTVTIINDEPDDISGLGSYHKTEREYLKKPSKKAEKKEYKKIEREDEKTSDFRANAKKWQDDEYIEFIESSVNDDESVLSSFSIFQWIGAALAVILFVSALFGTTVYAKNNAARNRENAMKRLATFELANSASIASFVETVEEPIALEEPEEETRKVLSLILSSVEKDLKIKLVDNEDTLVKNLPWSVTLTDEKDNETEVADDDEDGIIHLTDVSAGDYRVSLNPNDALMGYDFPQEHQMVSVKAKVEYRVIQDIKREIKTEKEVNAAVEDANGNQAADVETGPVVTDTVEWCESTKTAFGEEYIEATPDLTKTASIKNENRFLAVLEDLRKSSNSVVIKNGVFGTRIMHLASEIQEEGSDKTTNKSVSTNKIDYSDEAQLYDALKNALYVKDDEFYRLAKYKDYKSGNYSTYYRKSEAFKYTGWQTIDGRRFYYRSDNTFVTGEQIIGGIKYTFGADGALANGSGTLGIDVSKYQPSINWASVKASGVNYVIIRCGYRGSSTGVLVEDPYFRTHIKGAKAAGLKVGVYFFTTALNEAEAVEEASMCAYLCSGYGIDYPIFMDCESSNRPGYNGMSASQRTEIIKAFCNTIRSAGYTPGVYANKTWLSSYMNAGSLSGIKIWLAQYNSSGPTYSGRYDMWQYTSKGTVQGIKGYVDMNQSYMGY